MRLLVLEESANHVSCRYRVRAFEPALRRAGWDMTVRALAGAGSGFLATLREAARSDVVLIQRRLLSPAKLALLRRCARRLIFDFDDAVFLRDSNSARPAASWRRRSRFRAMLAASDVVIAGNDYLANQAAGWSPCAHIEQIPTCVNTSAYAPTPAVHHQRGLRLAWIGSRSTLASLRPIAPELSRASGCIDGFELRVICDNLPHMPGVDVTLRRWSPETEAHELAECDIGISWLPDHPWSRGKCGLKVLQYMAAGLPVVVNRMGVHCGMVRSGVDGMIVDQAPDLAGVLRALADDPRRRAELGQRGRSRVEAEYSVARWTDLFIDVISRRRPSKRFANEVA